jgi:hypothetical protein
VRHYLGISSRGAAVYRNIGRDETGEPLLLIDQDETRKLTIDFSDWLETGETIATVTATGNGCTRSKCDLCRAICSGRWPASSLS